MTVRFGTAIIDADDLDLEIANVPSIIGSRRFVESFTPSGLRPYSVVDDRRSSRRSPNNS